MSRNITNKEFKEIHLQEEAHIIDVRTISEVAQGIIPGAKHIDIMNPQFLTEVNKLPKDNTYLVYCRSGNRSSMACSLMSNHGFKTVYNLGNGIMGWDGDLVELEN